MNTFIGEEISRQNSGKSQAKNFILNRAPQIFDKPEAKIDCKMDVYAIGGAKSVTMKYVELGAERKPAYAVCMDGGQKMPALSVSGPEDEAQIYFEIRFFDVESRTELKEKRIKIAKQGWIH